MGLEIVNARKVIKDFNDFDKATQKRFKDTLWEYAANISGQQILILRRKVKVWTGTLASTIEPTKYGSDGLTYLIGPDIQKADYAEYVESGQRSFAGYWYVRDSVKKYKGKFIKALKRDIEESARA